MTDGECRKRETTSVMSALNHPPQPKLTSDVTDAFTVSILDPIKEEVPVEPRRHRKQAWIVRVGRNLGCF